MRRQTGGISSQLQILLFKEQTALGNYVQGRAPLKPSGQPSARRGDTTAPSNQPTKQANKPGKAQKPPARRPPEPRARY